MSHRLKLGVCHGLEWLCCRGHFITHHYPYLWIARWPNSHCSLAMVAFYLADRWDLPEYYPTPDLTEQDS